jgi:cyclic dehypoxanthinyl futalosine synthase
MATLTPELAPISIETIADKVYANRRISVAEARFLFDHPNSLEVASLANFRREQRSDPTVVTYIVGRILNYTNVCWVRCKFCAFYRIPGNEEGYTHSDEAILEKVQDTVDKGGVEILFQGGLNPKLKIEYYEGIFSKIMERFPNVILHALSPAEIIYIAHISKLKLPETLQRLRAAGLHSIPGAGGEILVDRVRNIIAPYKDKTEDWLAVMRTAAQMGIKGTASMMFGHIETLDDRIEHLSRIRDLQDECQPFRAFVTWNFQPEDTQLQIPQKASAADYLRTVAISRIFLDNFDNVQLSILTQGPKIAQMGLKYGANDFGSVMIEENVVSAAGNKFILNSEEFERLIKDAGYEPRRRNTRYELIS